MRRAVYLDYHATTPVDPRVLEAMTPYFTEHFGNAASRGHRFGWTAEKAVEAARRMIADTAGAQPREIVFTSGGTEALNLAIKGAAEANQARRHLVVSAVEHKAVLDSCRALERRGWRLTIVPVESDGRVDPAALERALEPDTLLAAVMYANNEIGTIQRVSEIGSLCRARGVLYVCDAVQAFGKIPLSVERDGIDMMAVASHKIYGPKGIGALYIRRRAPRFRIAGQIDGGGHEGGLRSGTLNVPGIVGFGRACAICSEEMESESGRTAGLRDRLLARLRDVDGLRVNGSLEHRLPNNLNVSFDGVDADALLTAVSDVAVSTGSACSSAAVEPSHVLRALGIGDRLAHSSVRFGIGRFTTGEEIDYAASRFVEAVSRLRALSPAG